MLLRLRLDIPQSYEDNYLSPSSGEGNFLVVIYWFGVIVLLVLFYARETIEFPDVPADLC